MRCKDDKENFPRNKKQAFSHFGKFFFHSQISRFSFYISRSICSKFLIVHLGHGNNNKKLIITIIYHINDSSLSSMVQIEFFFFFWKIFIINQWEKIDLWNVRIMCALKVCESCRSEHYLISGPLSSSSSS